jgi:hypothetical protein
MILQYFAIAPGSRSSPLAAAAAANPRATCVSCIDERSLAFHAVGYGRGARKPAAVITSSGTAVSNLLPAVCSLTRYFRTVENTCVKMILPVRLRILVFLTVVAHESSLMVYDVLQFACQ